jgi:hypothetical protein
MVDVSAFVKATSADPELEAPEMTYRIGRHALADLALQFGLEPASVDRLSDADFDDLFDIVERSAVSNVDRETARRRLDKLRTLYEPNAQALADYLALELPPWSRRHDSEATTTPSRFADRDLVG